MGEFFEASRPDAIERLARIEGQSNFLSVLAGVEAGQDTTQDMAALAMARTRGAIPEVLETYVAQTTFWRLPLMSMVFAEIKREIRPKAKDYPWIQGAIADAFHMLRIGNCKDIKQRARRFRVQEHAYSTIRKFAHGILSYLLQDAEFHWKIARLRGPARDTTSFGYGGSEDGGKMLAQGCWRRKPLPMQADGPTPGEPRAVSSDGDGFADRLGWDERRMQEPVCEIRGPEAAEHVRRFPSQLTLSSGTAYLP
jgi:hypothetical protein